MNIPLFLRRRELFGLSTAQMNIPFSSGICKYRLKDLLSAGQLSEVFLGFTSDGRFLISYILQVEQLCLRFWLIPSIYEDMKGALKHPFVQFSLETYPSRFSFLSSSFSIRFLQSINDPQQFVLLFFEALAETVSMIWGSMPEPNCAHCRRVASQLSGSPVLETPAKCPYHLQLFRLYPDNQTFPGEKKSDAFGLESDEDGKRLDTAVFKLPVPSCFLPVTQLLQPCVCFANPICLLQPSVCPETGRLRVSWISQGGQIRVLSCSLSSGQEKAFACHLPSGSYHELRRRGSGVASEISPPLAYQSPLLTSNYCSTCFFWPPDTTYCRLSPSSTTPIFSPITRSSPTTVYENDCVFSTSSSVRRVLPNEAWPDGHRNPILPESKYLRHHKCTGFCPTNVWVSSLLTSRKKVFSCSPVSYLAMLQDIRASYIHWALVPNEAKYGDENGTEDEQENNDPNARSGNSLVDTMNNPEMKLVNQLSGQCHSYFESTDWHEVPIDEIGQLGTSSLSSSQTSVVAHMEEVVFDLPDMDENSCMTTTRTLFTSPVEPDWLLVYESNQSRPVPHLVTIIDLASGMQRDPDEVQYASRLATMTSQCPSLIRFSALSKQSSYQHHQGAPCTPFSSTLLELNNYGAYTHGESLSCLTDPQGGYAFYL